VSKQRVDDAGAAQLSRAVEALCARVDEGRATLNCAIADGSAAITESVRSVGAALVAALSRRDTRDDEVNTYSETDARYARRHGGRCPRPIAEKTVSEQAALQQLRNHRHKKEQS
jgi:hypothetical protein